MNNNFVPPISHEEKRARLYQLGLIRLTVTTLRAEFDLWVLTPESEVSTHTAISVNTQYQNIIEAIDESINELKAVKFPEEG